MTNENVVQTTTLPCSVSLLRSDPFDLAVERKNKKLRYQLRLKRNYTQQEMEVLLPGRSEVIWRSDMWHSHLLCNKSGVPKSTLANALHALRFGHDVDGNDFFDGLGYNEFTEQVETVRPTFWGKPAGRPWTDDDDRRAAEWLQKQDIAVSTAVTAEAVQTVARELPFHPVQQYLRELKWDGKPRLDLWLVTYAGADDSPLVRAVGSCFLISAVARVMKPGCKADHVLILEGPQGIGKSSLCQILGGEWFTDEIADLDTKDAAIGVAGAWIIELSELGAAGRTDQKRLKAFLSRPTDRFRPPYGRHVVTVPRQCVFIGTTNDNSYLKDETGGRRFWPVKCGRIDLSALARHRDQLWAEAVHRYDAGDKWFLDDDAVVKLAVSEQKARYEDDPWHDDVVRWVDQRQDTSVGEILGDCLGILKADWSQTDMNRVARILKVAGFEKYQRHTDDGRQWRYRRCSNQLELKVAPVRVQ